MKKRLITGWRHLERPRPSGRPRHRPLPVPRGKPLPTVPVVTPVAD